ncbi:hypothetical protein TrLO_g14603 [Triparma laevis f. longispina]|uniref:Uncharacterized protein n=1 Tax=Triparma laevis f. longispina TaxID=1714387 RepID=A0A9W7A7G1_9STRA|nr:hypothetical protein TrLO_g14603 [Triparma laevis f. longispina]
MSTQTYPFPPSPPSQSPVPISDQFFELANASTVAVADCLISQNNEIENSTGGVIWESAYLLYDYLTLTSPSSLNPPFTISNPFPSNSLTVISDGPGLLSICLSSLFTSVIATEIGGVVPLLELNVKANKLDQKVKVIEHDWTSPWFHPKSHLVLTTDTLFSSSLVRPLLLTLNSSLLPSGTVYVCSQERCLDSILEMERLGPEVFDQWEEVSEEVWNVVQWGREVGGRVWRGKGRKVKKRKGGEGEKKEEKLKKEKKEKKEKKRKNER